MQACRKLTELAIENDRLWRRTLVVLRSIFRRLKGSEDRSSVRVGDHYRALGKLSSDTMKWVWIGTHAEYDQLVDSE